MLASVADRLFVQDVSDVLAFGSGFGVNSSLLHSAKHLATKEIGVFLDEVGRANRLNQIEIGQLENHVLLFLCRFIFDHNWYIGLTTEPKPSRANCSRTNDSAAQSPYYCCFHVIPIERAPDRNRTPTTKERCRCMDPTLTKYSIFHAIAITKKK